MLHVTVFAGPGNTRDKLTGFIDYPTIYLTKHIAFPLLTISVDTICSDHLITSNFLFNEAIFLFYETIFVLITRVNQALADVN